MWRTIFDPENLFFRILSRCVDFVGLSLLWVLLCFPMITAGAATSALYYTIVKTFRYKKDGAFGMFFKAFRRDLKKGIPVTVICMLVLLLMGWGYAVMSNHISTSTGVVMYMAYYIMMVVPVGMMCYLFPLMGRFEMRLSEMFQTSFVLAMRHLPSTVIIVMMVVEFIIFTIENWWPVLFVPSLTVLLASLFLERIFKKYLNEDEAAVLTATDQPEEDPV
jgi:uncharacterized membrane protein YesL